LQTAIGHNFFLSDVSRLDDFVLTMTRCLMKLNYSTDNYIVRNTWISSIEALANCWTVN